MVDLRMEDKVLSEILNKQLEEYVIKSIPQEKLDDLVSVLMRHVRKNARTKAKFIQLDIFLQWDKKRKELMYKNKILSFTKKEKQFLVLIFKNLQNAVSYESICMELWGKEVYKERVKTLVKQIRKKVPANIIKNVFDFGYKIEIASEKL